MVPINDMAEDAVDKMYQSSGMPVMIRKKSTIQNKMVMEWKLIKKDTWTNSSQVLKETSEYRYYIFISFT